MADFATERLEPASGGVPVSAEDQRDVAEKRMPRAKVPPHRASTADPMAEAAEPPEEGSHQFDQLA